MGSVGDVLSDLKTGTTVTAHLGPVSVPGDEICTLVLYYLLTLLITDSVVLFSVTGTM